MVSPNLYILASDKKYDEILERVKSHPQDLRWTDSRGVTCLHALFVSPPWNNFRFLRAVKAIVDRKPSLLGVCNETGFTPLHTILRFGNIDTLALLGRDLMLYLIRKFPEAVSIPLTRSDDAGTTPFHCACQMSNIHIDILKSMLETNVKLATTPCTTNNTTTALELLWSHFSPEVDDLLPCSVLAKMELVLLTAFQKKVPEETQGQQDDDDDKNLQLLCAACAVQCPVDYFRLILSKANESLLTKVDSSGKTPLHYAVMNTANSKEYSAMVIRALLEKDRSCGACSPQNLHAALHHGGLTWHEGAIKELLYSHPDSLIEPDVETRLYPFLLASLHNDDDNSKKVNEQPHQHLSTAYELLLASPDLVQMGIEAAVS